MNLFLSKPTDIRFKYLIFILPFALISSLIAGCASTNNKNDKEEILAVDQKMTVNDFPTLARIEYVLQCMQKKGGQNYDTLFACVCSIDKIAAQMSYDDYTEAQTFTYLRSTPGEKGAIFRDPPRAKQLRKQLKETIDNATASCSVNN